MLRFAWEKRLQDCGGSFTVDGTSSLFIPAKEVPASNAGKDVSCQARWKWKPSSTEAMTHATRRGSKLTLSWPFLI